MKNNIWKYFLITDLSSKVITVFKDIFLGIYFLKITDGNIIRVSLFYITFFLSYILFFYIINKVAKSNLLKIFRMGLFLNLVQCLILLISGKYISNYIISFAVLSSIANAFYYYPQQMLIKRLNNDDNFNTYFTINKILKDIIKLIFPTILGFCITNGSYSLAFFILTSITFISFILSFAIKGFNLEASKINLSLFFSNIKKNNKKKQMMYMTFRSAFRSLSSFGVIQTLITLLTFYIVSNEFSLGKVNSFVTVISMIVIYVFNKCIKKETRSKLFLPIAIIQSFVIIGLTTCMIYGNINTNVVILTTSLNLGFLLMIVYNIVNGISNPIFEVTNEIIYYDYMSKQNISIEDEPNYFFYFEVIGNMSRSLGYIILILVASFGFNINVIASLIVLFSLIYIALAYTLKEINNKYI